MSNPPPSGVWGKRNSNSAARTPQNRSNAASPSQQNPSQPPKQESKQPQTNVWQQRASQAGPSSNGPSIVDSTEHKPVNGFNLAELQALAAQQNVPAPYKPQGTQGARNSASLSSGKMANGKTFWQELAKQVAELEKGG